MHHACCCISGAGSVQHTSQRTVRHIQICVSTHMHGDVVIMIAWSSRRCILTWNAMHPKDMHHNNSSSPKTNCHTQVARPLTASQASQLHTAWRVWRARIDQLLLPSRTHQGHLPTLTLTADGPLQGHQVRGAKHHSFTRHAAHTWICWCCHQGLKVTCPPTISQPYGPLQGRQLRSAKHYSFKITPHTYTCTPQSTSRKLRPRHCGLQADRHTHSGTGSSVRGPQPAAYMPASWQAELGPHS